MCAKAQITMDRWLGKYWVDQNEWIYFAKREAINLKALIPCVTPGAEPVVGGRVEGRGIFAGMHLIVFQPKPRGKTLRNGR